MKSIWILAFFIFCTGLFITYTAKEGRTDVYDLPYQDTISTSKYLKSGYYDFRLRGEGIAGQLAGEFRIHAFGNAGKNFQSAYFEYNFTGEDRRDITIETVRIRESGNFSIFLLLTRELPEYSSVSLLVTRGYYADFISYQAFSLLGIGIALFGFLFLCLLVGEHVITSISIADKSNIK